MDVVDSGGDGWSGSAEGTELERGKRLSRAGVAKL